MKLLEQLSPIHNLLLNNVFDSRLERFRQEVFADYLPMFFTPWEQAFFSSQTINA